MLACVSTAYATGHLPAAEKSWNAGFGKVVITPTVPMFASGYGSRTTNSDGKIHDLYVRAAALQDPTGQKLVFVALDLIGEPVADTLENRSGESHVETVKSLRTEVMHSRNTR